jgi:hypothetical protein
MDPSRQTGEDFDKWMIKGDSPFDDTDFSLEHHLVAPGFQFPVERFFAAPGNKPVEHHTHLSSNSLYAV